MCTDSANLTVLGRNGAHGFHELTVPDPTVRKDYYAHDGVLPYRLPQMAARYAHAHRAVLAQAPSR